MTLPLDRRNFLKAAGTAVAASGLWTAAGDAVAGQGADAGRASERP